MVGKRLVVLIGCASIAASQAFGVPPDTYTTYLLTRGGGWRMFEKDFEGTSFRQPYAAIHISGCSGGRCVALAGKAYPYDGHDDQLRIVFKDDATGCTMRAVMPPDRYGYDSNDWIFQSFVDARQCANVPRQVLGWYDVQCMWDAKGAGVETTVPVGARCRPSFAR